MSLTNRLRTVYLSQIKALKDHLERLDLGLDSEYNTESSALDPRKELFDSVQPGATVNYQGQMLPNTQPTVVNEQQHQAIPPKLVEQDQMMIHYKVLGVPRNADLPVIKDAWMSLRQRCDPSRFPEGSEERTTAGNIQNRVDESWKAIRDYMDPQTGRFDKLEI